MAYTFWGIGTTYYGRSQPAELQSPEYPPGFPYIKTEWLTFFWVPLWPLDSYLVHEEGESDSAFYLVWYSSKRTYRLSLLPRLYRPQVVSTYIVTAVIVLLMALLCNTRTPPQHTVTKSKQKQSRSLNAIGIEHFENGMFDSAATAFSLALEIEPLEPTVLTNRAMVHFELGELVEAWELCAQAISADYGCATAHNLKGMILDRRGDFPDAIAAYSISLKFESQESDVWSNRAQSYRAVFDYSSAIVDYETALTLAPDDPELYNGLGLCYFDKGSFDSAVRLFDRAIDLDSTSGVTFYNRAIVYLSIEKRHRAMVDLKRALELEPGDPDTYYWLATVSLELERISDAIRYLRMYIELAPPNDTVGLRIARESIKALESP